MSLQSAATLPEHIGDRLLPAATVAALTVVGEYGNASLDVYPWPAAAVGVWVTLVTRVKPDVPLVMGAVLMQWLFSSVIAMVLEPTSRKQLPPAAGTTVLLK